MTMAKLELPDEVNGVKLTTILIALGLDVIGTLITGGLTAEEALQEASDRYEENKDAIDELAAKGH